MWIWTAATPPRFAVGSVVDTKDVRKEQPPMPSMSQTGKAYRLPCPRLFRVLTTTFTASPRYFRACSQIFKDSGLSVSGLFLNAGAGFDSAQFRRDCHRQEVFPNVAFNKRRGMRRDDELLDELLYKERYSIERTNAWIDSYRSVLNRFDTTQTSWEGWNYIAFILIFPKKIRKREKSR